MEHITDLLLRRISGISDFLFFPKGFSIRGFMPLYLTLELCSLAIPLIFSFDKKVAFYKHWKILFLSIIFTGIFFITTDIIFTKLGIWGFNPRYHLNFLVAGIPIEEWLFFLVIPYASIFTHFVFISYFPNTYLSDKLTRIITWILIPALLIIIVSFYDRAYTFFYAAVMTVALIISSFDKERLLNRFYITFLIILVPFFLINGILTGSFIAEEVVWYNGSEISDFRIFTVPFEDIMYGFSLILINLLLMSKFKRILLKRTVRLNEYSLK